MRGDAVDWDSMRATIGKEIKQLCAEKDVKMAVIPGGLTPCLQTGDVGIFKYFRDMNSTLINRWKRSDLVLFGHQLLAQEDRPRRPSEREVK